MGIIEVARWKEAPAEGFDVLKENIVRGQSGKHIGFWRLLLQSYRSAVVPSRSIYSISTSDHTYAILEDQAPHSENAFRLPPRVSFVTIGSLDGLPGVLAQIGGAWSAARTNATLGTRGVSAPTVNQLIVDGVVYSVGTDWIVRLGAVRQGQTPKGLIIEVEYLPLREMPGLKGDTPIITEFLSTIAPKNTGADPIVFVNIDPATWASLVQEGSDEEAVESSKVSTPTAEKDADDDIFMGDIQSRPVTEANSRERRSSYLILRCLQNEGLL